ncbi:MAG: hypothetical protein Q9218_002184, partial [Villophora microphyllina]
MRDYLRGVLLLAAGLSNKIGADALGVTLTTRIPVCYPNSPPGGLVSATTYQSTLPNGVVSTVTSSTTLPAGSVSTTVYQTTLPNGVVSTVTSATTLPPPPPGSVSVTTYQTTLPGGLVSMVTSSTTLAAPPPPPPGSTVATTYETTLPGGSVSTVTTSMTMPPAPPPVTTPSVSMSTYTTTGPNGSPSVVTTSTTVPPPPPVSTSQVTYTTTNPAGSIVTTSRPVVVTPPVSSNPPSPSSTVIVRTTTNPGGSVVVVSTTSQLPVSNPPQSTVIVRTTTSPGGVVVVSSTTSQLPVTNPPASVGSSAAPPGVSSSPASTATGPFISAPCGGSYTDSLGYTYHIDCGYSYSGNDLPSVNVPDRDSCFQACDQYIPSPDHINGAPCVGVTYGERTTGGVCYLKYNISTPSLSRAQDSGYLISYAGPPAPVGLSGTTTPPANTASTRATSSSSTVTINPTLAAQPCPQSDGQTYIDPSGVVNDIACNVAYPGNDLSTPHFDAFEDCIHACDTYIPDPSVSGGQSCVAATWSAGNVGGNCYLKYAIGQIRYGNSNDCSAKLHNYTIPSGVSSSSTSISRTTTRSSTSTIAPINAGTTSTSPPPSTSSTTALCPTQNLTTYTDPFTQSYEIHCGQQISGDVAYRSFHADSLDRCLQFCDILTSCVGVTYPGDTADVARANCYPYTAFRSWTSTSNTALTAGRPVNGSTGGAFANQQLCPGLDGQAFVDATGRR